MQKGFVQLLLLLVALIIISGGVYFYQKSKAKPLLPNPKLIVENQPKFNDYNDTNLGFEFKYSKDLSVKIDSEIDLNKRGGNDFRKNFKGYVEYEPGQVLGAVAVLDGSGSFDNNPFSVWIFDNSDNLTKGVWFDKYWYYPYLWGVFDRMSKEHVTPDQGATISGQITKYKIVSYQPNSPKYIYLSKNGKMYLLRVIGKTGEEILTSFKLNQLSQTYTCPENGWENCGPIAMPDDQYYGKRGPDQCSKEALDWKKKNCSNFQGAAY